MKFKMLLLIPIVALLAGCSSLPSFLGGYKNQLESIVGVTVAGKYKIEITKDDRVLVTESWECTTDGAKLTGCHKIASVATSPAVAVPE